MTTQDAATIAASIGLASVAGHNLRALLLRLLDGEDWRVVSAGADANAFISARTRGFVPPAYSADLTPLGREVAERLRPVPWAAMGCNVWRGGLVRRESATCIEPGIAKRIAALFTQDDLRAAKTYRTEPDHV